MALRQPGKGRMPKWIWLESKRQLPIPIKRFVRFIWRFGPEGCPWWNCVLARYFKVTPRTIRRWLHVLKYYPLIAIAYPDGRNRIIRRLPYYRRAVFEQQRPLWLSRLRRTQMSALDNPPEEESLTDSPPPPVSGFARHGQHQRASEVLPVGRTKNSSPQTPAGFAVQWGIELKPGDEQYLYVNRARFKYFYDIDGDGQMALSLLLAEKDLEDLQRQRPTNRSKR